MKHLNRIEKTLFVFSALVFALFSYFLYDDSFLFPLENQGSTKLVGQMKKFDNDVRRKGAESFLWRPVMNSQSLYQKDSLFTGNSSQATIQLNDGSTIQIKENTLITLNFDQGQLELDLKFGDLSTQLAQKSQLQIKSGIEKIQIGSNTNSKLDIKKPRSQKIKLNLIEGSADVKSKTQSVAMTPNIPLQVKAADIKEATPVAPEIQLLVSDKAKFALKDERQAFVLKWQSKEVATHQLQISNNKDDFSSPIYTKETENLSDTVTMNSKTGEYYWKVIGYDSNHKIITSSPIRKFDISVYDRPVISSPAPLAQLEYEFLAKQKDRMAQVDMQWSSLHKYKIYEWELSTDENFTTIVNKGTTSNIITKSPQLSNNTYHLRVRGITQDQQSSLWSLPQKFTINFKDKKVAPLEAPKLLTQKILFDPIKNARNPASVQAPQVLWKKVPAALNYEFELAKSKDFKGSIKKDIKESQFLWQQYLPGTYYFRVRSLGAEETKSPPSETGTIEVKYSTLTLSPLKNISEKSYDPKAIPPSKDVDLHWTTVPRASAYVVEFSNDKDFKEPQKRELSSVNSKITIDKPGTYHFRVAALDSSKKNLTEFSSVEKMTYDFKYPLPPPALSQPRNETTLFLQQDIEPFIWLNWAFVERATAYELEISDQPSFKKSIIKLKLQENRFLVKEKIPLGDIYWRVRAIHSDDELSSTWSSPRVFHLFHKKNENNFQ